MYQLILCSILLLPYLIPFLSIRKLETEPKLIISFWLIYRLIIEGIFLVPAVLVAFDDNNSRYIFINAIYISFINIIIAIIIILLINYGKKNSSNNTELGANKFLKENHILISGIILFIIYVIQTEGWAIVDPRIAYQNYRAGIGFIWAGYIFLISVWVVVRIFNKKQFLSTFIVATFFYYFSGSKALIFLGVLPILASPSLSIKNRIQLILVAVPIGAIGFLILFSQFSADDNIIDRLIVYFDMFAQSKKIFEDYDNGIWEFRHGEIYISSLWQYVPRFLYENKPYAWGATSLIAHYYPGMAETGHTPSFGLYTVDFADFGYFGFITVLLSLDKIIAFISLYKIARNCKNNLKMYVISYAFLVAPGVSFHVPIMIGIVIMYFLLKIKNID